MKEYRMETLGGAPKISNERDNRTQMGKLSLSNRCQNEICTVMTHGEGGMKKGSDTKKMGKNPMTGGKGTEYRTEWK